MTGGSGGDFWPISDKLAGKNSPQNGKVRYPHEGGEAVGYRLRPSFAGPFHRRVEEKERLNGWRFKKFELHTDELVW